MLKQKLDLSLSMPEPDGLTTLRKEKPLRELIPYTVHYDDETIITKDDGLVQVIKLDGLYYESLTLQQIKQFERQRNTILRSIANSDRGVYVHLVRRKVTSYPGGEGESWFSRAFNAAWKKYYEQNSFFVNDIYISIVQNRVRQGYPGIIDRIAGLFSGEKLTIEDVRMFDGQAKKLYEVSNLLMQTLQSYGARRLRIQRVPEFTTRNVERETVRDTLKRLKLDWSHFQAAYGDYDFYDTAVIADYCGQDYSEIQSFLHYLVNLQDERVVVNDLPIDRSLAVSRLNSQKKGDTLEVIGADNHRLASILTMAEWPSRTSSAMLNEFLKLPVEFIITQSFFFLDRVTAEHEMRLQKRRMEINNDIATEQAQEITKGLNDLGAGRAVNGLHHLTMLVHVPHDGNRTKTLECLEDAVGLIKKAFVNLGVKPMRETIGIATYFLSQLPGQNPNFMAVRGKIKSSNFAGFASLHNFASGKLDGNLWGNAVMPFETESGTAYNFNFHREMDGMVAGHTAFTADTGAGKTTLLSALIAMADKARPRVFWFDNRHGAEVFMRAMGGQHTLLTAQGFTGWNPFKLSNTVENRLYLVELLTLMRTCYGGTLSPEDVERFKQAVHENYELPFEDRRLRNIAWCFGNGELAKAMQTWHNANGYEGANWQVFDNEHDAIDLSACRYYCYEMRQLLKDGMARPELPVILSYPFHRIEQAMNGEPFIIVLEEGQNLVRHDYWKQKIDSYIMQIRRKNGLLIFVTPDAKYLYSETDSIQKQTATKIFLPNSEASYEDYVQKLGLTQAEYEFVRDTPVEQRKFLIRRGNESIKAVFDLSAMPEFIPVLSSNDRGVALMHYIMRELQTDDPTVWVPIFMQRSLAGNTHNLTFSRKAA